MSNSFCRGASKQAGIMSLYIKLINPSIIVSSPPTISDYLNTIMMPYYTHPMTPQIFLSIQSKVYVPINTVVPIWKATSDSKIMIISSQIFDEFCVLFFQNNTMIMIKMCSNNNYNVCMHILIHQAMFWLHLLLFEERCSNFLPLPNMRHCIRTMNQLCYLD